MYIYIYNVSLNMDIVFWTRLFPFNIFLFWIIYARWNESVEENSIKEWDRRIFFNFTRIYCSRSVNRDCRWRVRERNVKVFRSLGILNFSNPPWPWRRWKECRARKPTDISRAGSLRYFLYKVTPTFLYLSFHIFISFLNNFYMYVILIL